MATDDDTFEPPGGKAELEEGRVFTPKFGGDGLIPAIVTDAETGSVLMFAHMNATALKATIETGTAHFYSRSRGRLWKKGEDSGNLLQVVAMRTDCDQDVVWLGVCVAGQGAACHTGRKSCFYREVQLGPIEQGGARLEVVEGSRAFDPADVYRGGPAKG